MSLMVDPGVNVAATRFIESSFTRFQESSNSSIAENNHQGHCRCPWNYQFPSVEEKGFVYCHSDVDNDEHHHRLSHCCCFTAFVIGFLIIFLVSHLFF